jgi:aspartate-semialdehyde dehydrogenase
VVSAFFLPIGAHQALTDYPTIILSTNSNNTTGVLGCTGSVGQRFILLLAQHPHFTLHAVGASSRSAGKKYKDAVKWKQASPMGKHVEELIVKECKASEFADCDIVFSGLDADVAGDIGNSSIALLRG